MVHLPAFIQDLGVILITAAITTLIFRVLRQPVVLGYLVAGFLVSPHVSFLPTVTDLEGVKIWAEIGVVFLLFSLGLEFSFRKLFKVGSSASITAIFEVMFMMGVGALTGYLLGWSTMDSLFLGGILSISSTTIIIRALDELGMKKRGFVSLVFAALIVEDLVAIVLLVILSTLAASTGFSGTEFLFSTLRLPFFMVLWFVTGVYLLPTAFQRLKRFMTDETILIFSLGLCLGMVILATSLGFSPALGAFVMGSLIAETKEGKKIEHILISVRDLFAAVFFVSVGILIEPAALQEHWVLILLLTLLTIFGKLLSTSLGAILSGQSLKHSIQAGFSLAQIGEFSFIIATLGMTLKVTSDFLYPVAVAVSAITTFTTPYLIRLSDPFYLWLEERLPERFVSRTSFHQRSSQEQRKTSFRTAFWHESGPVIIFNSVLVIGISYGSKNYLAPLVAQSWGLDLRYQIFTGFLAFFLSLPFLWAISGGRKFLAGNLASDLPYPDRMAIVLLRLSLTLALIALIIYQTTGFSGAAIFLVVGLPIFFFLGNRYAQMVYEKMESRFIQNLSAVNATNKGRALPRLAPWDASLTTFTLSSSSTFVGKSLIQIGMKEKFGVTVVAIERAGQSILAPGRDDLLLPMDRLLILGTDAQLAQLQEFVESPEKAAPDDALADYQLLSITLRSDSPLVGYSIRESQIRELTKGLVVGIEREGQRILNPDSSLIFKAQDLLWLVANRTRLHALRV